MKAIPTFTLPKIPYRRPWLLWLCSVLFAVGYIYIFLDEMKTRPKPFDPELLLVPLMLLIYLAGFVLSWFREKTAGYIFIGWYLLILILGWFVWPEAGMVMALSFPLLPIGIFYVVYSFRKIPENRPEAYKQWKLALRLFILSFLFIFVGLYGGALSGQSGFLAVPTVYIVLLGILYIATVVLTWIQPLISGILLLVHGAVLLIFGENMLAVPMFVIGLGYLILWITVRKRELLI